MNINETEKLSDREGFWAHCAVANLLLSHCDINPHTKHHIRGAVREASKKVTPIAGKGKDIAPTISAKAYEQIKRGHLTGLVLEHAVPISFMNALVLEQKGCSTTESIAQIILEWTALSVITLGEHDKLANLKLSKTMPEGWDRKDKYARYLMAGIEVLDISYKDAVKNSS